MNEESITIVINPMIPLQEIKKEQMTWNYKLKRFKQDPPWPAIFCCGGCLAFGIGLLVILILNVKEFSMN